MLKLNLASGQRPFGPPFVNVDVNPKWNPDAVADMRDLSIFADGSADLIVIHHGVEHVSAQEIDCVWRECARVLAPGGSLIVTVPDMRALAAGWLQGRINDELFMANCYGAYMDNESDRHRAGYTRKTLERELKKFFADVRPFDFRAIPGADIAGHDWWILELEAFK